MAHQHVGGIGAHPAFHGAVLVKGAHDRGRKLRGSHLFLRHTVDVFQWAYAIDLEDVDLVCVSQHVAMHARSLVESGGKAPIAVRGYGGSYYLVVGVVLHEGADLRAAWVGIAKQHVHAKRRMRDRRGVVEGVKAPYLLKAANVVKQSAKPCEVGLRRRDTLA